MLSSEKIRRGWVQGKKNRNMPYTQLMISAGIKREKEKKKKGKKTERKRAMIM